MPPSVAWPDFEPQNALALGPLGAAQAADRAMARAFVARLRALAEFAGSRPASADRSQGEPGAMSAERWAARPDELKRVSEWAAQECSIALVRGRGKAEGLLAQAVRLVDRLPGALAALEGGLVTLDHLPAFEDHVAPIADDRLRAEIEAEVLRWIAGRAARRTITTPAQLRDKALREMTRRNARDAAQKALRALRDRGVFRYGGRGEGLAELGVVGTVPEIEALQAALAAYVDALPKDRADTRTRGQKTLDVLLDLVLRRGEHEMPPVQVVLTLVAAVQTALGGDQPAELNGKIVSAETARQLLNELTGAGLGKGALAELRRLADDEPGSADREPAAQGGLLDDPGWEPWEPQMRAALAEWEAGIDRRLAAGEFDDPDPMPDAVWAASVQARLAGGEVDLELDRDLAAAQDRWWAEFEAGRHRDPDPPDDRPDPPPSSGWWAAAERALTDATVAQEEAERALTRAGGLVRAAVLADVADEEAWRAASGGRGDAAEDAMTALRAATVADRTALHDLLGRTAGGGLAERPRVALVDAVSGALVSLTDLPGLRRVTGRRGLGAPPPTDGYRPGAELDRFIRRRDRRCRFPGCRLPVSKGELDHRVAWPRGATDVTNLAGFCTGDHRGKHQAPGFGYDLEQDGTLVVTTPSGLVATTEPPPY